MSKITFEQAVAKIAADDIGKRDLTVPMGWVSMDNYGKIRVGEDEYCHTDYSLSQIFDRVGMPITYEKKLMAEYPELVAQQFNFWKEKNSDKDVLLRYKEDGNRLTLRAFLSGVYTPLDNHDIYDAFGVVMNNADRLEVEDFYMDDGRSRMRVTIPELERMVGITKLELNDILRVGFDVINSEIGRSSLAVSPVVYRLVCTNGMKAWVNEGDIFKQRHSYVDPLELRAMMKQAIGNSIRNGDRLLSGFIQTQEEEVESPFDVIAELGKRQEYSTKFIELTKDNWRIEPDRNMYGVINAFTRSAQTLSDESRLEVETFAGSLIRGAH